MVYKTSNSWRVLTTLYNQRRWYIASKPWKQSFPRELNIFDKHSVRAYPPEVQDSLKSLVESIAGNFQNKGNAPFKVMLAAVLGQPPPLLQKIAHKITLIYVEAITFVIL